MKNNHEVGFITAPAERQTVEESLLFVCDELTKAGYEKNTSGDLSAEDLKVVNEGVTQVQRTVMEIINKVY